MVSQVSQLCTRLEQLTPAWHCVPSPVPVHAFQACLNKASLLLHAPSNCDFHTMDAGGAACVEAGERARAVIVV